MTAGKKLSRNQQNVLAVMRFLADNGPSTQIQATNAGPLRRTSVFNTFDWMQDAGLLEQSTSVPVAGKGRPSQLWQLNGALGDFVTAYVNTHSVTIRRSDFGGQTLETVSAPSASARIDGELELLAARVAEWSRQRRILGVMLLLPGRIDFRRGFVHLSKSWNLTDDPLRDRLRKLLADSAPDALVLIENNARMCAWGQRFGGACTGLDDYMALTFIEGRRNGHSTPISIGSGAILGGRLYRGSSGGAGELDENCHRWFSRLYVGRQYPVSLLELDRQSREYFAAELGESFAHLVNYLEPERLVVIFEQTPVEDFFLALRREIHRNLIYIDPERLAIEVSSDGIGSTIRGGLALLREHFFADERNLLGLFSERLDG